MKNPNTIPPQQAAKSIFDLTPFEMAEIEAYQQRNRGFDDGDRYDFIDDLDLED